MSDLAWWLRDNKPGTAAALQAALDRDLLGFGLFIAHTDPPDLPKMMAEYDVSIAAVAALENDLRQYPWWRLEMRAPLQEMTARRVDMSHVALTGIDRPALMTWLRDAGIAEAALQPLNERYVMCSQSNLRQIAEAVTDLRQFYRQQPEVKDCDKLARQQWGGIARLWPGNLAIGLCGITCQIGGQPFGHVLLLAACNDGLFFIENDGTVYRFSAEYWNRSNVAVHMVVM